ncbi:unnamed protein product [Leptidea sinapis]|uniref:Rhodanese domain-containing protein n=1 Tax=Leptidea sinapis TaxID=189913 RepID=A0A5E4QZW3_9NEOP|nr:unnamed protein product [Leptidea sinapis]
MFHQACFKRFARSYQIIKFATEANKSFHLVCSETPNYFNSNLCAFSTAQIKRLYTEKAKLEEVIVDFDHVKQLVNNKNTLIIDVREPEEVTEHGKIPNSINIPLGTVSSVLSSMSDTEFSKSYGRTKPSENTEIIFYCMIGKRSGMAQQNAFNLGYKNVKNYLGSWTDWKNKSK